MTSRFQFMHSILCKYRTQLHAEWWATAYAYLYLQRLNIPARGNGKGAETAEVLCTVSQLQRWAAGLCSGCWDVEQKLIGRKLGYSWVFWEGGKELAHSSFISDTAAVAVSLSQGSLWTKRGSGQSNWAACKAGGTARSDVLATPLAQIELWGCMTTFSGHSCHTSSLPLGKRIIIFA